MRSKKFKPVLIKRGLSIPKQYRLTLIERILYYRDRQSRFQRFLMHWPNAWLELIESIIWIFTFGQYKPSWSYKNAAWWSRTLMSIRDKARRAEIYLETYGV